MTTLTDLVLSLSQKLDELLGIKGVLGYMTILSLVAAGHMWANHIPNKSTAQAEETPEEPDPPRNFTKEQLAYFDGTVEEDKKPKKESDEPTATTPKPSSDAKPKPVYLSLNGTVFDVSEGRNFYGPGGPYECFAGHECGIALAKMSFDSTYMDQMPTAENLNHGERMELEGWIEKFTYYRCYPIKGKLVMEDLPDPNRVLTADDLAKHSGAEGEETPTGYATAPIYVGAGNQVFDVSFGGGSFYGPGGSYSIFAGKDASRALAKMSLDPTDLETSTVSDLEEKQKGVLKDWIKTFGERKKYPVVGQLGKESVFE